MQRKAAAIYFAFFVVMSASAYSVVAVADAPGVELDESQSITATPESSFELDGVQHDVSAIEEQESEGGHGGGGATLVGTVTYTQPNVEMSETFENASEVDFRGGTYVATMDSESGTLVLTEQFDVTALLEADAAVANSTVESDGQTFVRYTEDNTLVPLDEYLPEPEVVRVGTGETLAYTVDDSEIQATVDTVTTGSATITWTASEEREVDLEEGSNVTLADGNVYVTHFQSGGEEVVLSQDHQGYAASQDLKDAFHQRENGLWGVSILSALAGILVLGTAYMPVRG